MKNFCKDLKENLTEIIHYQKKKILPLTTEKKKSYYKQKTYYICQKELSYDNKNRFRVWDHCHHIGKYGGTTHDIYNL